MNDDATLLQQFAEQGDSAAIADLIRRHIDAVYSAALRRVGGDQHLAADVTQQVFVAMTRQARTLHRHPCLGAWLHRATRNQAANLVRLERRRKAREETAMSIHESPDDWRRVGPVLDEVIDELSQTDRVAVILRYFERRTFADIGQALDLSEDGARRRVERALEKLRSLLAQRRIASAAAALAMALTAQSVGAAPVGLAGQVTAAVGTLAPAALGPTAAFLTFMSTTKVAVISGSAAALICGLGITWPAWQNLRAERAREAERAAVVAKLQQERSQLEQRLAEQETQLERAETEVKAKAAVAEENARSARSPMEIEGDAILARHPALRAAFQAWAHGRVEAQWGPFLHAQRLTPAQREAFVALMTEGAALGLRRGPGEPNWYLRGAEQAGEDFYGQMREVLGEQGLRAFREYRREEPARRIATHAAGALALTESPLQPGQLERVARVLAEHSSSGPAGVDVDIGKVAESLRGALNEHQREIVMAAILRAQKRTEMNRLSIRENPPTLPARPQS